MQRNDPDLISATRSRSPDWFTFADSVSAYCTELTDSIQPNKDNGQHVLSSILFRRMASSFEAVVLLAERGMHTEGLIQRRSMLEAIFILRALFHQPDTVHDYIQNDLHRRRDIYKNIANASKNSRERILGDINTDQLHQIIQDLETQAKGVTYLKVGVFAQRAKLYDLYLTDYCLLSEAAHHVAKDLERHIVSDQTNEVEAIVWGMEPEPPIQLLFPAIDQMLMGVYTIAELFNVDIKEKKQQFSTEWDALQTSNQNDSK